MGQEKVEREMDLITMLNDKKRLLDLAEAAGGLNESQGRIPLDESNVGKVMPSSALVGKRDSLNTIDADRTIELK